MREVRHDQSYDNAQNETGMGGNSRGAHAACWTIPIYLFAEPRVGYRMPRGRGVEKQGREIGDLR